MGRPPKGFKEYKVQLDPKAVEAADEIVGTYKRSEFIREAMKRELSRREKS